jgi:N-glycosylase/DNA lyase
MKKNNLNLLPDSQSTVGNPQWIAAGPGCVMVDHEPASASQSITIAVRHYDLAATLTSGQAFRWSWRDNGWIGVIGGSAGAERSRWVRLQLDETGIRAETAEPVSDWRWLTHYLQTDLELDPILSAFPDDEPMRAAVNSCAGLRLLRQPPWECLASFILSSTKQIVQIRQIVALLCERFGEPVPAPDHSAFHSFPSPERLARATEAELRACKMGFRAPYLLATAQAVADGNLHLESLRQKPAELARAELMQLPGVGRKIADCVLLFAYGFPEVFPVDVWVTKALRRLYFPRRRPKLKQLRRFSETHFGAHAGYAQQYLFHYVRTKLK